MMDLRVTTDRLLLRPPVAADMDALYRLTEPPEMRTYLGITEPSKRDSFDRMMRNAGGWALFGYGIFMVEARDHPGEIIGTCGMFKAWRDLDWRGADGSLFSDMPEAGWIIAHQHWGKGYAKEAMRAAINWFAQTHGAQPIGCMIETGHQVSDGMARSLGFVPVGEAMLDEYPVVLYRREAQATPKVSA